MSVVCFTFTSLFKKVSPQSLLSYNIRVGFMILKPNYVHLMSLPSVFSNRRAPPVEPEILRSMKTVGFIGYAANPRTRPRNLVCWSIYVLKTWPKVFFFNLT